MVDFVQRAFQHYSKWDNLKELFVIPYKREHFKSTVTDNTVRNSKFVKTGTVESKAKVPTAMAGGKASLSSATPKSGVKANVGSGVKKSAPDTDLQSDPEQETHSKPLEKVSKEPITRAKEIEEYLFKEVYFARSKVPRTVRPPQVKLKVGQVVKHKQDGYIGVIVGWDEEAKVHNYCLALFCCVFHHLA